MAYPTVAEAQRPASTDGVALPNPYTGGRDWYRGTAVSPEELDGQFTDRAATHPDAYQAPEAEELWCWNAVLGTHFTADHAVAEEFARGEHESDANSPGSPGYVGEYVVHAGLAIANPKVCAAEHDMGHEVYEHEHELAAGNHPGDYLPDEEWIEDSWPTACAIRDRWGTGLIPPNATDRGLGGRGLHPARTVWLTSRPDKHGIAVRFRERPQALGHDGIGYRNEYETCLQGAAANQSAIAFGPDHVTVTAHHEPGDWCATREPDREAC